jgi:hypothetical protein
MTNIVSNYRDYYDYLAMYGIEKDMIYHRKERIIDLNELLQMIDKNKTVLTGCLKGIFDFIVEYVRVYYFKSEIIDYSVDDSYSDDITDREVKSIFHAIFRRRILESSGCHFFRLKLDVLIICGKFYPVFKYELCELPDRDKIILSKTVGNDGLPDGKFYKEINDISMKYFKGELPRVGKWYKNYYKNEFSELMKSYEKTKDGDYSEINRFSNSPFIKIKYDSHGAYSSSSFGSIVQYVINPVLFPYQQYLPDSRTIWTELNTWLSNRKNETYKKDEIMPDVVKLEKKGFDRKTSFRKGKSSNK